MATVNLTASGGNDTGAIQAAIDAAAAGDTLDFAPGDYQLDGVTLKSGVTYHGEAGAVLHATDPNPVFSVDGSNSHDITIDGLNFVGTGADPTSGVVDLSGTGAAGSVDHITLSNSSFQNNGLTFDFVKNSHIVNDQFSNIQGVGTGVHGYHLDNSTIGGNTFTNDYQAVGLVFGGADNQGHNVVVADNVGTGTSRIGIEIIGSDPVYPGETTNLLVQGNQFSNWGTPSADGETTAYSIVTDGGTGTHVVDNYAQGSHNSGVGIELAGVGAVADGNYLDGFSTGVIGYSSQDVIQNNNIINYSSAMTSTYTQTDEIVQNNTSDPSLAHPTMAGGSGYAVASNPTPTQAPAPSPDAAGSSGTVAVDATTGTAAASSPDVTLPVANNAAAGSGTSVSDTGALDTGTHATVAPATVASDTGALDTGTHATVAPVTVASDTGALHTGTTGALDTGAHATVAPATVTPATVTPATGGNLVGGGISHDTFALPTAADGVTTHAAAGTDLLDPNGTLGWTNHQVDAHVPGNAAPADGATLAATGLQGDGLAAAHSDVALHDILPAAHNAGTDYVWHH